MEPTQSSPLNPDENSPSREEAASRSPNDPAAQFRPDPLLTELRSGQYDTLRLEAAIALFCADIVSSPRSSRSEVRTFSEPPPEAEQLEGPIRSYFWPAYDEGTSVVRERFETVAEVVRTAIAEHLKGDTPHEAHARIMLHSIVYSEAASCLTSNNLSGAIRDLEYSVDTTILRPFHHHIEQELGRLEALNRAGQLPDELRRKAAAARIDQRVHEADAALKAVDARLDELSRLFLPLTQQAMSEFSTWIPEQSPEYIPELADYVRSRFALPFSQALSDIRNDTRLAISEGIGRLETALSSGASDTAH